MTDWVIDWSAWEATETRLAALRAAVADEGLRAAHLRARVEVAALLLTGRPRPPAPAEVEAPCAPR